MKKKNKIERIKEFFKPTKGKIISTLVISPILTLFTFFVWFLIWANPPYPLLYKILFVIFTPMINLLNFIMSSELMSFHKALLVFLFVYILIVYLLSCLIVFTFSRLFKKKK